MTPIARLEQYSLKHPQEVLLVTAEIAGQVDQVMVYRGFSSSIVRSTAFDPDVPVLPPEAKITGIDRLQSPYQPDQPQYLQQGLTWSTMELLLQSSGV